jgi:hypothetical protein
MHALLNILLNCDGDTVDIGKDLNHFKEFTNDFSSMVKKKKKKKKKKIRLVKRVII